MATPTISCKLHYFSFHASFCKWAALVQNSLTGSIQHWQHQYDCFVRVRCGPRGRRIGNWAWPAGWKWSGRPTEIFSGTLYDGFTLIFVVTGGLLSVWTFCRQDLNSKHPRRVMQNPNDTLELFLKQCMSFSHIIFTTLPFINIFIQQSGEEKVRTYSDRKRATGCMCLANKIRFRANKFMGWQSDT